MSDPFTTILDSIEREWIDPHPRTRSELDAGARLLFSGRIFVSHTAADSNWCKDHIIRHVTAAFGYDSYFFLSSADSRYKVETHRVAVTFAFKYSKTIVIALSQRSIRSNWARLEATWAVEQMHPIIICSIDDTTADLLHPDLGKRRRFTLRARPARASIDFSRDISAGEDRLASLLQKSDFRAAINREAQWAAMMRGT
jgi:hypothetical protein